MYIINKLPFSGHIISSHFDSSMQFIKFNIVFGTCLFYIYFYMLIIFKPSNIKKEATISIYTIFIIISIYKYILYIIFYFAMLNNVNIYYFFFYENLI